MQSVNRQNYHSMIQYNQQEGKKLLKLKERDETMHYIVRVYYTVDTSKGWDSSDYAIYTKSKESYLWRALAKKQFVDNGGSPETIIGSEYIKTCRY